MERPIQSNRCSRSAQPSLCLISCPGIELRIILNADAPQKFELSFQEIDVSFFIGQQLGEKLHRDVILLMAAEGTSLHVEITSHILALQIALQNFLNILTD